MSPRRGDSLPTVWPRPAHTKAKHDILVKYLQAWFAIMGGSRYDQKVGVFDGFAGPGLYDDGEPGSPVLVVDALLGHDYFSRWTDTEFIFLFNEILILFCIFLNHLLHFIEILLNFLLNLLFLL